MNNKIKNEMLRTALYISDQFFLLTSWRGAKKAFLRGKERILVFFATFGEGDEKKFLEFI